MLRALILGLLGCADPPSQARAPVVVAPAPVVRPAPVLAAPPAGVQTGDMAPALDLPAVDGTEGWSLERFVAGQPSSPSGVMVAFMASWCGPCAASLPTLAELQRDNPELLMVFVAADDTAAGQLAEQRKIRAAGLVGPVLAGDPGVVSAWTGGARSVPRFVFIDGAGRIVAQDRGFGDDVASRMPGQARKAVYSGSSSRR